MAKKLLYRFKLLLLISAFSCNLFEPREIDSSKYYTQTGEFWILEGKKKMQKEQWSEALSDFEKARTFLNKDGKKYSEAYFYLGKCILRMNEVDLSQVWDEINPAEESDDVPFLYNPENAPNNNILSPLQNGIFQISLYDYDIGADKYYQADTLIDSVFLERKRIYDAMTVAIKYLDTIYYNDDEMDGVIRREHFESDYLIEISVTMVLGISDINNNGKLDYDSEERTAFKILSQDVPNLNEMSLDSLKNISKNPNKIKENLDLILHSLELADNSHHEFNKELIQNDMDPSMIDDIGNMIGNFKEILPYFYYDDYTDNDDDWYNTNQNEVTVAGSTFPKKERMIWIDWDSDNKIDINPPSAEIEIHIGDTDHMAQNPALYEIVDTADTNYNRYRYKGTYCYEFIGGDWGCDEEMMDGYDNDMDGLVDEDSRNVSDTLDDDGDWYNTDTATVLLDTVYNPLVWKNSNNNAVIDLPLNSTLVKVPLSTQFKTLHSLAYPSLYGKNLHDSINSYQGTYGAEFIGGDYGIDEEWYDGIDNDGDGLIDEDVSEYNPPESLRQTLIDLLTAAGFRG